MSARTPGVSAELTAETRHARGGGHFPGLVGLRVPSLTPQGLESRLEIRERLHHAGAQGELLRHRLRRRDPGNAEAHKLLGNARKAAGNLEGTMAAYPRAPCCFDQGWTSAANSCLNRFMRRWYFGYFFTFPRHLAEGNG